MSIEGRGAIVDEEFCFPDHEISLTVSKTSVFFHGDGLLAYDPQGKVVFRVDSYGDGHHFFYPKNETVIMDSSGKCLLSLHRKVYGDPMEEYLIEGSFSHRSCTIYHNDSKSPSKGPVAEIKQKVDPNPHAMLGKDVFLLCLKPMVDGAFMMGLVLVLDQMVGDGDDGYGMELTVEDLPL